MRKRQIAALLLIAVLALTLAACAQSPALRDALPKESCASAELSVQKDGAALTLPGEEEKLLAPLRTADFEALSALSAETLTVTVADDAPQAELWLALGAAKNIRCLNVEGAKELSALNAASIPEMHLVACDLAGFAPQGAETLSLTRCTGASAERISALPALAELRLSGTKGIDNLLSLKNCPALKALVLTTELAKTSDDAIAALPFTVLPEGEGVYPEGLAADYPMDEIIAFAAASGVPVTITRD